MPVTPKKVTTRAPIFTPAHEDRFITFPMRLSQEERDFLEEEAKSRGVNATQLIRDCVRRSLIEVASQKQ